MALNKKCSLYANNSGVKGLDIVQKIMDKRSKEWIEAFNWYLSVYF